VLELGIEIADALEAAHAKGRRICSFMKAAKPPWSSRSSSTIAAE